jgi:hypothetical protein
MRTAALYGFTGVSVIVSILVLPVALPAASVPATITAAAGPTVKVYYSPSEDRECSAPPRDPIKEEWKAELLSRQSEFVTLWEAEGPRLIAATEVISGKNFPSQQVAARLTLYNAPSESLPGTDRVIINMRYALKSFTAEPVSLRYKVDILFHELLHIFLGQYHVQNTALLKQHAAEDERVRDHLHLLALQKAVLLKLDERDALKDLIAVDSVLPGGYYKRGWELVNATDDEYLKYVAELSK